MPGDLPAFYKAKKTIPGLTEWIDLDGRNLSLTSPLDILEATVQGLSLRATATQSLRDRNVCFQLEFREPGAKPKAFARIEWRPLRPHDNKGSGPAEWRYKRFKQTHSHPFDLNWSRSEADVRKGEIPIALPVSGDPDSYEALLDLVRREFRIMNASELPPPPWQDRLL